MVLYLRRYRASNCYASTILQQNMEKFIVSARKYRPQTFDTVVGQDHITTTLKNAIKNKQLAHAFLFCGPRGVGKTTCARILAKTINCEQIQPDGEACNECTSCRNFNEGTSFNIHELDAASNNSVDDIRALVEQVRFSPQAGLYKVYIVDEVHMLSSAAFNAFLKTLEEPPAHAIFILATTEKHKILPTILSRCQIFDFKRITSRDTVKHLEDIATREDIKAEKAALQVIAQKSEGCMRDALSIMDKIVSFTNSELTYQNTLEHLNILDEDYYFKLLKMLLQQDLAGSMLLFDEINRKGFEGDLVLNGMAEFMRNLLVARDAKAAALLEVVEGMQPKYAETAREVSMSFLVSALNILNEAEINYKTARNKRLHVELCIIKLNFLQQTLDLASQQGGVVNKKAAGGPVAIKFRNIRSYQLPQAELQNREESKLYIQEKAEQPFSQVAEPSPVQAAGTTVAPAAPKPVVKVTSAPGSKGKQSLLDKIKTEQLSQVDVVKDAEPLNIEKLQNTWNSYTTELEKKLKHSVASTFKLAKLTIVNEGLFSITVQAITQQKFIEQEKTFLLDVIQKAFHNRNITFEIQVDAGEPETAPAHLTMNPRQRFEYLSTKYPLLAELRDKLKLELDII